MLLKFGPIPSQFSQPSINATMATMATSNGTTKAPDEWKVNPHHGNINHGTKQGQAIFDTSVSA